MSVSSTSSKWYSCEPIEALVPVHVRTLTRQRIFQKNRPVEAPDVFKTPLAEQRVQEDYAGGREAARDADISPAPMHACHPGAANFSGVIVNNESPRTP